MRYERRGTRMLSVLVLSILAFNVWPRIALAKKQPKTYPEEAKVIGTSISQSFKYVYRVETNTRIYELECDKLPRPGLSTYNPRECGGAKKIQIGDVIHFRSEKGWAYIPITETDGIPGEQRLRIHREELKPGAKAD
jgi:hypothetical protein